MKEKDKTYGTDSYIRIGDKVEYYVDDQLRAWTGNKNIRSNGAKGVVVGFKRLIKYVNRNRIYIYPAGTYEENGGPIVKWDDETVELVSSSNLIPVDMSVIPSRKSDLIYRQAFKTIMRIGDLPETQYYEDDIVTIAEPFVEGEDGTQVKITDIDYFHMDTTCADGVTPYPFYSVAPVGYYGGYTNVKPSEIISLISRGNYWKYAHGEPLDFQDICEELNFYTNIGECQQIINPESKNYVWDMQQIVAAIENKTIAFCKHNSNIFGSKETLCAFTIPNFPELEERARKAFQIHEFKVIS